MNPPRKDGERQGKTEAPRHSREEIRTVGIVAKPHSREAAELIPKIIEIIEGDGREIMLCDDAATLLGGTTKGYPRADLVKHCGLVIVLGGDGTLLSLAKLQGERKVQILGVNMGYLGFLTEVPISESLLQLRAALNGEMYESRRMMLQAELLRGGERKPLPHVLNDVVINKSALARIFDVEVILDGQRITTIRADGIIVSTPTGSTAYNLAAGGPIIHPEMEVMVFTPICPHTLTNRPLVLPGEIVVELRITGGDEIHLTLDGQHGFPVSDGDVVRVKRSDRVMHLLSPSARSYFDVLKSRLNWGKR